MSYAVILLVSYLIGGINPAYIASKFKGFDIRRYGSGNAGATNAMMTMGKKVGILTAVFDILKAYFSVKFSAMLFPACSLAEETAGLGVILGHMYPAAMHFKGGKGLACLGGVILAFHAWLFPVMLLTEIVLALLTDYLCTVPITASVAFALIYYMMGGSAVGTLIYSAAAAAMIFRHTENLKRIREGTELRISILWNKDEELARLEKNGSTAAVDAMNDKKE